MNSSLPNFDFVSIHGTPVLGKSTDVVTCEEIESIDCDITTEAHLIRHFCSLPEAYVSRILGNSFLKYDFIVSLHVSAVLDLITIEELLRTNGSKFYQGLTGYSSPREVFDNAIEYCRDSVSDEIRWIDKRGREVAYFVMQAPHTIGTQNVMNLNAIASELKTAVYKKQRGAGGDRIEINFVRMVPPETDQLVIMLNRVNGVCRLETAYPGIIVTDLPQPAKQTAAELAFCRRAWESMAFIEKS